MVNHWDTLGITLVSPWYHPGITLVSPRYPSSIPVVSPVYTKHENTKSDAFRTYYLQTDNFSGYSTDLGNITARVYSDHMEADADHILVEIRSRFVYRTQNKKWN